MGKEDQIIAAIRRKVLFADGDFQGFLAAHEKDYVQVLREGLEFMRRGDIEERPEIQQPVPYVWIVNPTTKEIFAYKRAGKQGYSEARLRDKWSCGIGGHVEKSDEADPIVGAMMRELMEEVKMTSYPRPKIVGYINDDSTPVNSVHFGVVAIAETILPVEKGDDEMAECKSMSVGELEKLFEDPRVDVEPWTRISWPFVKKYIESL